jgi:6-phosphogluconolactonase (cycloisomerase 2 family)
MKHLIGYTAALCLLALMVGCGGVTSTGTLAYISNSSGTGFTVFTVNTDGTLTKSSISPQNTPASPKVLLFAPNGKWAYFLDANGANLYGYTRAGNGTLVTPITGSPWPQLSSASSFVISPGSTFLYVALPNDADPSLARLETWSIDSATGTLSGVATTTLGHSFSQMVLAPGGGVLYGLSPTQQEVVSLTLASGSPVPTLGPILSLGKHPDYMILSANGAYMYVLDPAGSGVNNSTNSPIPTPNIYGLNVVGGVVGLKQMPDSPFNGNVDSTNKAPSNPIAGVTSNDNRFLFVANNGTSNISIFQINSGSGVAGETGTAGELLEISASTTIVNGVPVATGSPFDCNCTPTFVTVSGSNNGLYVIDNHANEIFQFKINQNNGTLRAQSPAFVSAEGSPTWLTIR